MPTVPIRDMFETLVPEYDRFNRVSSLGLDVLWRKELVKTISGAKKILDIGTGTGDVARELLTTGAEVIGIDFSESMISAAKQKCAANKRATFQVASANQIPFEDDTFDGATSAFVIRNLHRGEVFEASLREMKRVLRDQGRMVHLELTRPPSGFLSWGHQVYLKSILPVVGKMFFGQRWPQNYLSETIKKFPTSQEICQRIRWAGFDKVSHYPLNGGIASLFCAVKSAS